MDDVDGDDDDDDSNDSNDDDTDDDDVDDSNNEGKVTVPWTIKRKKKNPSPAISLRQKCVATIDSSINNFLVAIYVKNSLTTYNTVEILYMLLSFFIILLLTLG